MTGQADFDEHEAYRTAAELTDFVYGLEDRFSEDEIGLLFGRLRAAAVDLGARLAEGIGRDGLDPRGAVSGPTARETLGKLGELRHYVLTCQRRFILDEHHVATFDALYRKMRDALMPDAGTSGG